MSHLFRSRRKAGLMISAIFLVLTLVAGTVAWVMLEDGALAFALGPLQNIGQAQPQEPEQPPQHEDAGLPVQEEPEEEEPPVFIHAAPTHNFPSEMRGVYLIPGQDFLTDPEASPDDIRAEVDAALDNAILFTMNTVIIQTRYEETVIFSTSGAEQIDIGFDLMGYIVTQARQRGLFVYAIFDASLFADAAGPDAALLSVNAGTISRLAEGLQEFATRYDLDAILIYGYTRIEGEGSTSFAAYLTSGARLALKTICGSLRLRWSILLPGLYAGTPPM